MACSACTSAGATSAAATSSVSAPKKTEKPDGAASFLDVLKKAQAANGRGA